ncbi:DUF455 family protein [Nocardia uniformis]|uniref:DUF455 family protein n=1 Tax=Nocardia uniformis TaxID=53432 RepID=A0A849CED3_9NOCA|nr:DUF455 family protein [Nocardia uniformis]NNH73689.1 DUF455 family protein [Nocardia uniformis]
MTEAGGTIEVDHNRRYLEAIRFGCVRLLELSSAIMVRTASTERKLELSHQIWALAQAAELIGNRLVGLRSTVDASAATAEYVAFTDAVCSLQNPEMEYTALCHLAYPDLRDAVLAHHGRVPFKADELTVSCLTGVLELLDAVPTGGVAGAPCIGALADLLADAGGVTGRIPEGLPERVVALPAIPIRPGRESTLRERSKGEGVSDGSRGSLLHDSVFRIELCAAEICAAMIAHHPDAPWGLRFDLAKQVRDEARHFELFAERMHELGVSEGDYPLAFDVWDKFVLGRTLPERLMIEQRLGEGTGLDGAVKVLRSLREEGDLKTMLIYDYIIADELTHVGNGNKWLRELTVSPERLSELDRDVRELLAAHGMRVKHNHPVNVTERAMSGFTEQEIEELQRIWEQERALAQSQLAGTPTSE